jgi:hypothetical protein
MDNYTNHPEEEAKDGYPIYNDISPSSVCQLGKLLTNLAIIVVITLIIPNGVKELAIISTGSVLTH